MLWLKRAGADGSPLPPTLHLWVAQEPAGIWKSLLRPASQPGSFALPSLLWEGWVLEQGLTRWVALVFLSLRGEPWAEAHHPPRFLLTPEGTACLACLVARRGYRTWLSRNLRDFS